MNNRLEVIGIDHGWSMMKTISQGFVHIAKLNGRVCGAKRPHSVFEQPICYLPV